MLENLITAIAGTIKMLVDMVVIIAKFLFTKSPSIAIIPAGLILAGIIINKLLKK